MEFLTEKTIDKLELYEILVKVFFEYIPNDHKYEALAEAVDILNYDLNKETINE